MLIVVTGGIGSGKSEACRIICRNYDFALYDADSRVKELYLKNPELLDRLENELDCSLRNEEGTFMPAVLAELIFTDKFALERLESIVFPFLFNDFHEFVQNNGANVIFESATILEKKAFNDFGDVIVLIDAPLELRLERACARDEVDRIKVQARMANQALMNAISDNSILQYPAESDFAAAYRRINYRILNNGSISKLEEELTRLMDEIINIDIVE